MSQNPECYWRLSFHECFPKFDTADTVMNLWDPSIQEFVLSENKGFRLAKTEILFKSKTVSYQFV